MGLFDWFRTGKKREDTPQDLYERQLRLEADQRALRREWENTHDSIVRTLAKIGRREKRAAERGEEEEEAPAAAAASPNGHMSDAKERFRLNNIRRH